MSAVPPSIHADGALLRAAASHGGGGDVPGPAAAAVLGRGRPQDIAGVALWAFIGVATALFTLFIVAYVMRMASADAAAIAMPPQLVLSTALLVIGSVLLQQAGVRALDGRDTARARRRLLAGGACALLFIAAQAWAWQVLIGRQVGLAGNPAGSFFYLLTALHALHVTGGIVAWAMVMRGVAGGSPQGFADGAWRVPLLARYWHFLLLAWLALYACFTVITPDVARIICRVP